MDEVKKAIKKTCIGKASGIDGLLVEIFKATGPENLDLLQNILTSISEEEIILKDFYDVIIVTLFKNKGDKAEFWNSCGISLLPIVGKIFAQVILNHLISTISDGIPT